MIRNKHIPDQKNKSVLELAKKEKRNTKETKRLLKLIYKCKLKQMLKQMNKLR